MESKFQSSFIPKGASAPASSIAVGFTPLSKDKAPARSTNIFGVAAGLIFTVAFLLSVGIFVYKLYLHRQIDQMSSDLNTAQTSLEPAVINDLARLNARLSTTKSLVSNHLVLSPFFDFLEQNTVQTVRFTDFKFSSDAKGVSIALKGQAKGYSAVALESDQLNNATVNGAVALKNVVFSDLALDDKGNVTFGLQANVDSSLLSYPKEFMPATTTSVTSAGSGSQATSTATSTAPLGKTATSTVTKK